MELIELLRQNDLTVTTAESCTGGLVGASLVDISGISDFFHEGYITYSAESKINLLGVPADVIEKYGIVSVETARAMALGACNRAKADCSIITTGVAGPGGGTKETPVGTVCFGCVVKGKVFSVRKIFGGNRKEVRQQACDFAIDYLIRKINEVTK